MLKVDTKSLGTLAVLRLEGRIVRGETEILRSALRSLPEVCEVTLDLSLVTTLDAGGLGMLLELREQAESNGTRFTLMNPSKPVSLVLEVTRLDSVFQISSGVEFLPAVARTRQESAAHLASCA